MQLNPGSSAGILDEIDDLCSSDSTSYPTADKVRRVNAALKELVGDILEADGLWQWDDTNHTDQPIATFNLTDEQESYTFASDYLKINMVGVLNKSGTNYIRLEPFDLSQLPDDMGPDEYFATKGFPKVYDVVGDSIFLYPAPDSDSVTLTAGLKVHFARDIDEFTTSDTTQEPGIAAPYHILLAWMAAVPYNMVNHPERVPILETRIAALRARMIEHYSNKNEDVRPVITPRPVNYR